MAKIAVAGHICLDIIPEFFPGKYNPKTLLVPGTLVEVGQAVAATGGAVSNTGQALHRLGEDVVLIAKVGNDEFGHTVRRLLNRQGAGIADNLIISPGEHTSYSIVINPPGIDRIFLHSPGANHSFSSRDLDEETISGCSLFHFGYPPLMKCIFERNGAELKTIFTRMKRRGITTSLDMTFVDPASDAGKIDWPAFLNNVLPLTDIFLPSLDEILFMTDRDLYFHLTSSAREELIEQVNAAVIERIAQKLIDAGVPVVVIKLGAHGLYLRTAEQVPGKDRSWNKQSFFTPAFKVKKGGTTGAGDCAIAGFLSAYVNGFSAEDALQMAAATGSACVESLDAVSAIPHKDILQQRIRDGWMKSPGKFLYKG
ncbi:MAG: carbohydrate kinase family protein [Kiritimatiellales bacterium]